MKEGDKIYVFRGVCKGLEGVITTVDNFNETVVFKVENKYFHVALQDDVQVIEKMTFEKCDNIAKQEFHIPNEGRITMQIIKEQLDTPICEVIEGATNQQTYREYIKEGENKFGLIPRDLNGMSDKEVNEHLDLIDYLWMK